jgi:hypothetical protein
VERKSGLSGEGIRATPIRRPRIVAAAMSTLCIVYLLQAATPLRLDDDAVDYLRMAAAVADGRPVPLVPVPIGYPVFLAFLDRAGLGTSFYFVLANCFFLALGLVSAWKILSDRSMAIRWCAVIFTLLAIPTIKSVPIALPEGTFFGLSLLALLAMSGGHRANGNNRAWLLGAALALTAIATSVRLVGVTLVPALIWSFAFSSSDTGNERRAHPIRIVWLIVAGLLVAGLLVTVAKSGTFSVYGAWTRAYYSQGGLLRQLPRQAATTAKIWGEVVLNLPFSRFRQLGEIFTAAGAAAALVVLLLMRGSGRLTPSRVYMLMYVVVLAVWPRPSPRLWMPIIPLVIGEIASAIGRLPKARWTTALVGTYCAWLVLTGIAALAFTSRITFSGDEFATVYGLNGGMASPGVSAPDSTLVHFRRYDEEAKKVIARYGDR